MDGNPALRHIHAIHSVSGKFGIKINVTISEIAGPRLGLDGTGHYNALLMVGTGTGIPMARVGLGGTGDFSPNLSQGTETVICGAKRDSSPQSGTVCGLEMA